MVVSHTKMAAFGSVDMTTTTWMKFFRDAGIPPQVAGNYAVLFFDHRIQTNMLQDLSRDILQAMGITVMGDVIAILKHAKQKYEQVTREKALGNEVQLDTKSMLESRRPIQVASGPIHVVNRSHVAAPPLEVSPIRTSTPVTRILDRLTQQTNSSPRISTSRASNPQPVMSRLSYSSQQNDSDYKPRTKKKSKGDEVKRAPAVRQPRTVISLKRKDKPAEEVPVKKVRRVLPEHEGRYSIKMPVGATAKTRRLLQQQTTGTTKSVFSRLGDPKVSSTTDNGSEGTKVTFTNFGRSVSQPATASLKNSSVFDRLGPGKSQVTSTSADNEDELMLHPREMLQYQGVLKGDQRHPPTAAIGPMKNPTKKISLVNNSTKSNILTRLGPQARTISTTGSVKNMGTPSMRLKMAAPGNRLVVRRVATPTSGLKSDDIFNSKQVPLKNRLGPKTTVVRQTGTLKIRTIAIKKKVNPTATLTTGRKLRLVNKPTVPGSAGGIFTRLGKLQL